MTSRSASTMSYLASRGPREHAAWNAFVEALKDEMCEEEILSLTVETVKKLASHYNFTSPLDLAHIEIAWGERQNMLIVGSGQDAPEQPNFDEEIPEPEPEPVVAAPATNGATKKRPSVVGAGARKPAPKSTTPAKTGASPKPVTPAQQVQKAPSEPKSTPRNVNFGASNSGDPNGKIKRKDVGSRIDTGAVRRATSYEDEEVICVEDVKDVFTRYAAYANGNIKEIDSSRFCKMIKECDLIDKLFTLREADLLFTRCKKNSADRRIPYHVFRMKLLPEMASKKHTAISEIIKMINHHGGPEIKQRPQAPVEEEYYEEEDVQEEPVAPPPPATPPARQGSAARGSTAKKTPIVPKVGIRK